MSLNQIIELSMSGKSDEEVMTIIDIMNEACVPEANGTCKKLTQMVDHIDDYPNQVLLSMDNEFVKVFYEEEYWKHAPDELKDLKSKLKEDPHNFQLMDRFSLLSKVYLYLIKFPWNTLPEKPDMRKKEIKRIVKEMSNENNYEYQ